MTRIACFSAFLRALARAHALWRIAVAHIAFDHIGFVHAVAHSQGRGCATMCNSQTIKECLDVITLVRDKDAFFEHYKR